MRNKKVDGMMRAYEGACEHAAEELFKEIDGKRIGDVYPAIGRFLIGEWEETRESISLAKKLKKIFDNQHHSGSSAVATTQMFLRK